MKNIGDYIANQLEKLGSTMERLYESIYDIDYSEGPWNQQRLVSGTSTVWAPCGHNNLR